MIPEPGFQKPMPYCADTVRRKSYTSSFIVDAIFEVDAGALLRLDQVVAVDGRRHRDLVEPGGHELEQRHLRGRVLHRDAVGVEVGVRAPALEVLALGIAEVVDEDLLGERQRPAEAPATGRDPVGERAVHALRRARSASAQSQPCRTPVGSTGPLTWT